MKESGVYKREDLDLLDELHDVLESNLSREIGALLVFMGVVREEGKDSRKVAKLEMESYEEHANNAIAKIRDQVKKKFEVSFVTIHHLLGEFGVGEPVVLVVVGGARRKDVFLAMDETVRRYKTEPALFKKEIYHDGSHEWVYPEV